MRQGTVLLSWLGLQQELCSVVAPDLEMDTATSVSLAAGQCAVYRVAVTAVHAAENRGLRMQYRSVDGTGPPTDGYVAYGMPAAHSAAAPLLDTSPRGLGVSAADGCWPTTDDVDLGGGAYGKIVDLALTPGLAAVPTLLPHDVPTDDPPESCELIAGDYWVYLANKGAAAIDLRLQASIDTDTSFTCNQISTGAVEENYWAVTMLIALGTVAGVALLGAFVWHCVCSSASPYKDHSDIADEKAGSGVLDDLRREEEERIQTVFALQTEGDALFASGDATGAAERYAAAAVLEPEGSERREDLEERLRFALAREKERANRVYELEDKPRPDQYYEDGHNSGTDDEEQVLGAVSAQEATTTGAEILAAVGQLKQPDLKTAAGRREEQAARDARLLMRHGGSEKGELNRTGGAMPQP